MRKRFFFVGVLVVVGAVTVDAVGGQAVPVPATQVLVGGLSEQRDSIVAAAAREHGMPVALAIAVSHVENWSGDSAVRHPASGATGLMQVLPRMWGDSFRTECGGGTLIERRRNACVGVRIALRYRRTCGNWDCALRLYVGATCTSKDTPEQCVRKQRLGAAYVQGVMQRLWRQDLSPSRDRVSVVVADGTLAVH